MFYVTTFYFDRTVEQQDTIRQKGFSKDGKIGKTQVVFGMLIDMEKRLVGYRIYQGDYFEGHSLRATIADLKKRCQPNRVIVVADRSMSTTKNRTAIDEPAGYNYITGERLRVLPKGAQDYLINLKND